MFVIALLVLTAVSALISFSLTWSWVAMLTQPWSLGVINRQDRIFLPRQIWFHKIESSASEGRHSLSTRSIILQERYRLCAWPHPHFTIFLCCLSTTRSTLPSLSTNLFLLWTHFQFCSWLWCLFLFKPSPLTYLTWDGFITHTLQEELHAALFQCCLVILWCLGQKGRKWRGQHSMCYMPRVLYVNMIFTQIRLWKFCEAWLAEL